NSNAGSTIVLDLGPSAPPPPASHVGLELPFLLGPSGKRLGPVLITQDFGEGFRAPSGNDHGNPKNQTDADLHYSVDFALKRYTPVLAQGNGVVVDSINYVSPGDPGPHGFGNYITIHYDDGTPGAFMPPTCILRVVQHWPSALRLK